jgi:small-conductance mechanosensitive channel
MRLFAILLVAASLATAQSKVVAGGREIVKLSGSIGPYREEARATVAADRIHALAESPQGGAVKVDSLEQGPLSLLLADGFYLFTITEEDARVSGMSRADLSRRTARNIERAVAEIRSGESWRRTLWSALKVIAVWAAFAMAVWLLIRAFSWTRDRVAAWYARKTATQLAGGFIQQVTERVFQGAETVLKLAAAVVVVLEFSFLLRYSLAQFPATAGFSIPLFGLLESSAGAVLVSIYDYLPSGFVVLVVLFIAWQGLRLFHFLFRAVARGEIRVPGVPADTALTTFQIVRVMIILLVLVVIFPYLPGSKSDAFKGISLFVGVLLSLGSGSAVSNLLSGVLVTYMRPFKLGDRVQIGETVGDVTAKTLLATRIRTIKNVEVVIPNSSVLSSQIVNYSENARTLGLILNTTITISYDTPWRKVHQLLIDAALATDGILHEPAPFVFQTSLNDANVSYQINAYTARPNDMARIYSDLTMNIQEKFNAGGVEIMSPSWLALRDGNTIMIPEQYRPPGYTPDEFRIRTSGEPGKDVG